MNADPPRHALCPACGHMGCEHLAAELEDLRGYRDVVLAARRAADLPPNDREPSLILWIRERKAAAAASDELLRDNVELRARVAELEQIRAAPSCPSCELAERTGVTVMGGHTCTLRDPGVPR